MLAVIALVFVVLPIVEISVAIQVAHHIEQDAYVVAALFSWDASD